MFSGIFGACPVAAWVTLLADLVCCRSLFLRTEAAVSVCNFVDMLNHTTNPGRILASTAALVSD
jgi:hypothetical protein